MHIARAVSMVRRAWDAIRFDLDVCASSSCLGSCPPWAAHRPPWCRGGAGAPAGTAPRRVDGSRYRWGAGARCVRVAAVAMAFWLSGSGSLSSSYGWLVSCSSDVAMDVPLECVVSRHVGELNPRVSPGLARLKRGEARRLRCWNKCGGSGDAVRSAHAMSIFGELRCQSPGGCTGGFAAPTQFRRQNTTRSARPAGSLPGLRRAILSSGGAMSKQWPNHQSRQRLGHLRGWACTEVASAGAVER
jgi:hypothetical protein